MICDFPNYYESHAIGVDCNSNTKLIWDYYEQSTVEYCEESLTRCCGTNSRFLLISHLGELVRSNALENLTVSITS